MKITIDLQHIIDSANILELGIFKDMIDARLTYIGTINASELRSDEMVIAKTNKIMAVKMLRERTTMSLKECYNLVTGYLESIEADNVDVE